MPLDDREQRILEEIEQQFLREDPKLAETVRTASLASLSSKHLKWALLAFLAGIGLMLGFFTRYTLVALGGFALMVAAVAWIVAILRQRAGVGSGASGEWFGRLRSRWRDS